MFHSEHVFRCLAEADVVVSDFIVKFDMNRLSSIATIYSLDDSTAEHLIPPDWFFVRTGLSLKIRPAKGTEPESYCAVLVRTRDIGNPSEVISNLIL